MHDEVGQIFNALRNGLRESPVECKQDRKFELIQDDLKRIKDSMSIPTQVIPVHLDKIDLGLNYLNNAFKYRAHPEPYDGNDYLQSRKGRSNSQTTIKNKPDNEFLAKLHEIKGDFRKLTDEIKRKESYLREFDIVSQRLIELAMPMNRAVPLAEELNKKEELIRQDELLKKDELIRKLKTELDAAEYLLKRKSEGEASISENRKVNPALSELLSQVDNFLSSMQRLQRAIAKNDMHIIPSAQKEFESRKKQLTEFSQFLKSDSKVVLKVGKKLPEESPRSDESSVTKFKVRPITEDSKGLERKVQSLEREIISCKKIIREYKEITEKQVQELNTNKQRLEDSIMAIDEKARRIDELVKENESLERNCKRLAEDSQYKQMMLDQKMKEAASFNEAFKRINRDNQNLLNQLQTGNSVKADKSLLTNLSNRTMAIGRTAFDMVNKRINKTNSMLNALVKALKESGSTKVVDKGKSRVFENEIQKLNNALNAAQSQKNKAVKELQELENSKKADKQHLAKLNESLAEQKKERDELNALLDSTLNDKNILEKALREAQNDSKAKGKLIDQLKNENKELANRASLSKADEQVKEKGAKKKVQDDRKRLSKYVQDTNVAREIALHFNKCNSQISVLANKLKELAKKHKESQRRHNEKQLAKSSKGLENIQKEIDELTKRNAELQEKNKDLEEQCSQQKITLNQQWENIALKEEEIEIAESKHSMDIDKLKNEKSVLSEIVTDKLTKFSNLYVEMHKMFDERVGKVTEKLEELALKLSTVFSIVEESKKQQGVTREGLEEAKQKLEIERNELLKEVEANKDQQKYIIEENIQDMNKFYLEKLNDINSRLDEVDRVSALQDMISTIKETTQSNNKAFKQKYDDAISSNEEILQQLQSNIKELEGFSMNVKNRLKKILKIEDSTDDAEELLLNLERTLESAYTNNSALKEATNQFAEENATLTNQIQDLELKVTNMNKVNQQLSGQVGELAKTRTSIEQQVLKDNEELKNQLMLLTQEKDKLDKSYQEETKKRMKSLNEGNNAISNLEQEKSQLMNTLKENEEHWNNELSKLNEEHELVIKENKDIIEKLKLELDDCKQKLNETSTLCATIKEDKEQFEEAMKLMNEEIKEVMKVKEQAEKDKEEVLEEMNNLMEEKKQMQEDLDQAIKEKAHIEESNIQMTQNNANLSGQVAELQLRLGKEKESIIDSNKENEEICKKLEEELNLLKDENNALKENMFNLINENNQMKKSLEDSANDKNQQQQTNENELNAFKDAIKEYEIKFRDLNVEQDDINRKYENKCKECDDITERLAELQSVSESNDALEQCMKENEEFKEKLNQVQIMNEQLLNESIPALNKKKEELMQDIEKLKKDKEDSDKLLLAKDTEANERIESYEAECLNSKNQLDQVKEDFGLLNEKLMLAMAEKEELVNAKSALEKSLSDELMQSKEEITHLKQTLEELRHDKDKLAKTVEEYGSTLVANKETSSGLDMEVKEYSAKCAELENKLKSQEETLQSELEKLSKEKNEQEQKYKDAEEQLNVCNETNESLKVQLAKYEEEKNDLIQQIKDLKVEFEKTQNEQIIQFQNKLEEQVKEHTKNLEELEIDNQKCKEDNLICINENKQLKSSLEQSENKLKELRETLTGKDDTLNVTILKITQEKDTLTETIAKQKEEIDAASKTIENLTDKQQANLDQLIDLQEKYESAIKEREDLIKNHKEESSNKDIAYKELSSINEKLSKEKEELGKQSDASIQELAHLKVELEEKLEQHAKLEADMNELTESHKQLQSQAIEKDAATAEGQNVLEELQKKVTELTEQNEELNKDIELLKESKVEELNIALAESEEKHKEEMEKVIEDKEKELEEIKSQLQSDRNDKSKEDQIGDEEIAKIVSERDEYRIQAVSLKDIQDEILAKLATEDIKDTDPIDGVEALIQKYKKEFDDFNIEKERIENSLSDLANLLPENVRETINDVDDLFAKLREALDSQTRENTPTDDQEDLHTKLIEKNSALVKIQAQYDSLQAEVLFESI